MDLKRKAIMLQRKAPSCSLTNIQVFIPPLPSQPGWLIHFHHWILMADKETSIKCCYPAFNTQITHDTQWQSFSQQLRRRQDWRTFNDWEPDLTTRFVKKQRADGLEKKEKRKEKHTVSVCWEVRLSNTVEGVTKNYYHLVVAITAEWVLNMTVSTTKIYRIKNKGYDARQKIKHS